MAFKKTIFFGLLFLYLSSCIELVLVDFPDHAPTPVIYSLFKEGEVITLHLSFADKLQNSPMKYAENAIVILKKNREAIDTLNYQGDGFYISNQTVYHGYTYELGISIPNYDPINHSVEIPEPIKIHHITPICVAGIDEDGEVYSAIELRFRVGTEKLAYHQVVIHSLDGRQLRIANGNDPVLTGEGLPANSTLFSTRLIEDSSYTMQVNFYRGNVYFSHSEEGYYKEAVKVEFRTVCEDYYMHHKKLLLYRQGIEPSGLGQPFNPVYLHGNLTGAKGVVMSYSNHFSDTIF